MNEEWYFTCGISYAYLLFYEKESVLKKTLMVYGALFSDAKRVFFTLSIYKIKIQKDYLEND